jgi:hypothetical protein
MIFSRTVTAIIFLFSCIVLNGQNFQIRGVILDEKATPLTSATVVLLNPADSTLLYYAIAGSDGKFSIPNIKKGQYLLQSSMIGYTTIYRKLPVPSDAGEDIGSLIMSQKVFNMSEVTVTGERIPMQIRKDTIEYNAKAFKVKSDAVAEDLIKKLPGIEVDRAGNIKAMGEDVNNVLVDGKEFFGKDPKVATRNLPADAIDKVQLYDKPSDESRFTGINDGVRDPTLNLVLDNNKKTGLFGDISAGAGTGDHYQGNIKAYRFTDKMQFAGLGMINNINEFGFSLSDYITFSGGHSALASGDGRLVLGSGSSFPVNFGQPVYGTGTNGAAGLNYSISRSQDNRFFISYLGNGSDRKLSDVSSTKYFTPDASFNSSEKVDQVNRDYAHRINFGLRELVGTKNNFILNGNLSYNSASNPVSASSESFQSDAQINSLVRESTDLSSRLAGNLDLSYMFKAKQGKTIFKIGGKASYTGSDSETKFFNKTTYLNPYSVEENDQFQNDKITGQNYTGTISLTQKTSRQSFLDLSVSGGTALDNLNRSQGPLYNGMKPTDTLSPDFGKEDIWIRPGITWKLASEKSQLSITLGSRLGRYSTTLWSDEPVKSDYFKLTPGLSWEYDYRTGRRLMISYASGINTPSVNQLMPVVNNYNALSLFYGNRNLKPEYYHNTGLSWWIFDQYSFTTFLSNINVRYTADKVNYSRLVDQNLKQVISFVNVKDDWDMTGNIDFSTPFRALGLMVNLSLSEDINRGISIINSTDNYNTSFAHRISLGISNRKKEKLDIESGGAFTLTDTRYSVQRSMNNIYNEISWFGGATYTPNKHFNFKLSADITGYSARTFNESQLVPLIGAEMSYYCLKNQRGVFTLAGVDLLNRNTGIERKSELNYLLEKRSGMIGRFVMFSFKYRLNKTGDLSNGIDIKIKSR